VSISSYDQHIGRTIHLLKNIAAIVALSGGVAFAQQADEEPADESRAVDEITVVAPKPGSRKKLDSIYEDPLTIRVRKDLEQLRIELDEYEWRKAATLDSPRRFTWGYDPRDDYRMGSDLFVDDSFSGKTKPATLFRIGF
jgi:hypothetical protein